MLFSVPGNKCDLEHLRAVKKEDAHKFAEEKRLLFLETSALDTTNVDKAFEWLVTGVYFLTNVDKAFEWLVTGVYFLC